MKDSTTILLENSFLSNLLIPLSGDVAFRAMHSWGYDNITMLALLATVMSTMALTLSLILGKILGYILGRIAPEEATAKLTEFSTRFRWLILAGLLFTGLPTGNILPFVAGILRAPLLLGVGIIAVGRLAFYGSILWL